MESSLLPKESSLQNLIPAMEVIGTISVNESGKDLIVEWRIKNFFHLEEWDGASYYSPFFSFGGVRWYLMIYPNGYDLNVSSGYVDLGLHKCFSDPSCDQTFSLSLKDAEGNKYNEEHYSIEFDGYELGVLDFSLIPRTELIRRKSELLPDDVLTVVCTMQGSTSAGSDMELLEATSEIDKLKLNSNQALQDEADAEKKQEDLAVLKENLIQFQRLISLEKENETNVARDEIIRPLPKTGCEPESAYVEACTQTLEEDFSFNNSPEDYGFVTGINHLLKENTGVDVTFELETPKGKTKIFAHQLILAAMSSYFTEEFYDEGRIKGHQFIPLKGVSPKAFEQMIRYCYGEKPSLKTTEDACALFKVASDFKVLSLQNLCHTFFKHTKIDPGSVFTTLKISVEMEDKNLQSMCYKILQEKSREVMAAYKLCDITPAMVYTLLNLPELSLNSEYELIKWICEWAKLKAETENSSSENAREHLESLLKYMNFLTLTMEEFANLCKDNPDFFSSDEIACICLNLACPGTRKMPDWYNMDMKSREYTGSN